MATHFTTTPKIHLTVEVLDTPLAMKFETWVRMGALPVSPVGFGYVGYLDVPDAEKVVEWLKAHGVEPRK